MVPDIPHSEEKVSYTDNYGQRIEAHPWWRKADRWANPVSHHQWWFGCDAEEPTPAQVYAQIAALPETPHDEMSMWEVP